MSRGLFLILCFCTIFLRAQTPDQLKALEVHNIERARLGVPALIWNENLEADAKKYADYLAAKEQFKHSKDLKELNQGENLYSFHSYTTINNRKRPNLEPRDYCVDASESWLEEKNDYTYAEIGSGKNKNKVIGHYTQMIWDTTKEIGIAYSVSQSGKVYVVARYFPSGNWVGEHPYWLITVLKGLNF